MKDHASVLVTGGAGFIGSHLVDRLIMKGHSVKVIDNLDTGSLSNIAHHTGKKEFHFIRGDIRRFDLVMEAMENIEVVFHEAALVSAPLSLENPIRTNDINVAGTLTVLKACVDLDVKRFIYASSAAVYGNESSPKKKESMIPDPTSPYALSKLVAESYVTLFHKIYGLETVSLRYFNVYGPRQGFNIDSSYGGVVTIFMNRILSNLSPIVYGDGEQTRDFVYIQDVVDANMLAMSRKNATGETLNIGSGASISINQLAELLKDLMNKKDIENIHADPRPSDIRHGYADTERANAILGYSPSFSIEEGLGELVNWRKSGSEVKRTRN